MNYHTYYKDDRCALKLVVYGLAVLTTLKSAQVLFVLSSLFERKALIPIDKKIAYLSGCRASYILPTSKELYSSPIMLGGKWEMQLW